MALPPIRLHDLRQGAATLALASGADLEAIQDMLGHQWGDRAQALVLDLGR